MAPACIAYIVGPLDAFLPKRWRFSPGQGSDTFMSRCAIASGLLEALLALAVLRAWYVAFFNVLGTAYFHSLSVPAHASIAAPEYVGMAGFVAFALNPISWLPIYFFAEGILRAAAAAVSQEVYGILPLYVLDCAWRLVAQRRPAPEIPLVCDEVLPGEAGCDLKIASCRKRTDWSYPFTIRFRGGFFQVTAEQNTGTGVRPHVYWFRRLPPGEIARGLRDYSPEDILIDGPRRT